MNTSTDQSSSINDINDAFKMKVGKQQIITRGEAADQLLYSFLFANFWLRNRNAVER
jgi:hypothetical protein